MKEYYESILTGAGIDFSETGFIKNGDQATVVITISDETDLTILKDVCIGLTQYTKNLEGWVVGRSFSEGLKAIATYDYMNVLCWKK